MTTPTDPNPPSRDPMADFQRAVDEGLIPRLDHAAMGLLMHPDNGIDAHFAVQLGAMVLMDKPIMVVVDPDYEVPAKLRAIADEIVVWSINDPDKQPIEDGLMRMARRFGGPAVEEALYEAEGTTPDA